MPFFDHGSNILFSIFCRGCGSDLCDQTTILGVSWHGKAPHIVVQPCPQCVKNAVEEALEKIEQERGNFSVPE